MIIEHHPICVGSILDGSGSHSQMGPCEPSAKFGESLAVVFGNGCKGDGQQLSDPRPL